MITMFHHSPRPYRLSHPLVMLTAFLVCACMTSQVIAQDTTEGEQSFESFMGQFTWTQGPNDGDLGDMAQIGIPEGYRFTGAEETQKILEAFGNPTSGNELGLLAPDKFDWFVVFEFSDVGYIKDDDKDQLDPVSMLDAIREGTEASNQQRASMGAPPMEILGWEVEPHYNEYTHHLEWAIRGRSEGTEVLNYNTRLLGRSGVMEVALVVAPDELRSILPTHRKLLEHFSFDQGHTYAEYQPGDHVAQYGLAALVMGGAALGAAKLGLFAWAAVMFKKVWKLLILAGAAVVAFIRRLIHGGDPKRKN